eukprot:TRINITY_DN380_c0_g1_i11.p1 TRINITY_DN380_c0_g1~~TRINITY_DN380_c0_g1_i11.p1  ORF type:complete len:609 (+),score=194.81 TRINITY_DN380_c0_g1_i11:38-1828(+)
MQPMMMQPGMVMQPGMMVAPVAMGPAAFKITAKANKLDSKDGVTGMGGTSDPFVTIKNAAGSSCGKSQVIMKDLSPKWAPFEVDAIQCGGVDAPILVQVFDWDKDGKDDFIGEYRTTLREMQTKMNAEFALINNSKRGRPFYKNSGYFTVVGMEAIAAASKNAKVAEFVFSAKDLDRKDISGKSDPYFVIYGTPKVLNAFGGAWGATMGKKPMKAPKPGKAPKASKYAGVSGKPVMVFKSKPVMKTLDPTWEPFVFESRLCGGSNCPMTISVYDWDENGTHDIIGSFTCTFADLMVEGAVFPVINHHKKENVPFYKNSGLFKVKSAKPSTVIPVDELTIQAVVLGLGGHDLASRDTFSKSDPFVQLKNAAGQVIYRSEEYMNDKKPTFKEVTVPVVNCGGLDGSINVEMMDWDNTGKHDIIGEIFTTLRELSFFTQNPRWPLINKQYKDNIGYRNSGFLVVRKFDFVRGAPVANVMTPVVIPGQPMMPMAQPMMQPGMMQPGMMQPGMQQPGMMQPGMMQPGMMQPGMQQPGMTQPGMMQPGMQQPGMMQPGMMPQMTPQQMQQMTPQQQQQMMQMMQMQMQMMQMQMQGQQPPKQ